MLKRIAFFCVSALLAFSCGGGANVDLPISVAHRGCWLMDGDEFYINENCPAGVKMAAQYGYPAIECDVKYTLDSVMVIMHDGTINRTMRNASDYSKIAEPVRVKDLTFEELRTKYVLESTDPSLRVPIPTLLEELEACRQYGIIPMLHSAVPESYKLAHEILGDKFIAFDASQAAVSQARDYSSCLILLDPGTDTAPRTIERLQEIGGNCGMSTMKHDMLDADYIKTIKDAGFEVQASIFPAPHEQRAVSDEVTFQLSDFWWYQTDGRKPIGTFRKIAMRLPEGQSVTWDPETPEYAAVALFIDFEGTVEITLNGRVYKLTHEQPGKVEVLGARLYKKTPGLKVRALVHSQVKSLKAELYDCGE
ncbi:MAG: hypothetical protein J5886_04885 [Bacteroidales bacterium]|nr:hypothetical protein [Bacteroidales bacterium]